MNAYKIIEWLVAEFYPQRLAAAGLQGHAVALQALDPITDDKSSMEATRVIANAKAAAPASVWKSIQDEAWAEFKTTSAAVEDPQALATFQLLNLALAAA